MSDLVAKVPLGKGYLVSARLNLQNHGRQIRVVDKEGPAPLEIFIYQIWSFFH